MADTPTINATALTPIVAGAITTGQQVTIYDQSGNAGRAAIEDVVAAANTLNGCVCVKTAGVQIASADILTLGSTPVPFGLTVPTDTFPDILTAKCFRPDVDNAYATNTVVAIRCVGADQPLFTLDFLGKTATGTGAFFMERNYSTGVNDTQIISGADLEVYVVGGNPSGGTFDMAVGITFAYTPA
jgi:hypothetical protein